MSIPTPHRPSHHGLTHHAPRRLPRRPDAYCSLAPTAGPWLDPRAPRTARTRGYPNPLPAAQAEASRLSTHLPPHPAHLRRSTPTPSPPLTPSLLRLRAPWVRQQFLLLRVVAHARGAEALLLHPNGITALLTPPGGHGHLLRAFVRLNRYQERTLNAVPPGRYQRSYRPSFMLGYAQRLNQLLNPSRPCPLPQRPAHREGYVQGRHAAEAASRLLGLP